MPLKKAPLLFVLVLLATIQLQAQYNIKFLGKKTYPYACSSIWGYTDTVKQKEYALVGTFRGLSIVDITNPSTPNEVAFVSGSKSSWRELKTFNHFAYVVHDVNDSLNEGLLIVDLQYLPDSVKTYRLKTVAAQNIIYKLSHTVTIDEKGFLYLNGGDTKVNGTQITGTTIFDLKPNPLNPTYIGKANLRYVHDCYVRNDILYQAHSNTKNTNFSIWNIQNRANPVLIEDFQTPYNVTHNIWLSDNSNTMFVTHESASQPIEVYDVTDLNNIQQLQTIKSSPNETAIAHNVHVWNDYLVVPHYTLGVVIWDALDPTNIVKIGYYDTNNYNGSSFNGVWGAYPYFADSTLILSDIEGGLFILKPNYIRAARIQGTVSDTNTVQALTGVKISFADTSISVLSAIDGTYKTGTPKAGTFLFKAEKTGYQTKFFYATLTNGSITIADIQLRQIPIEVSASDTFCEGRPYPLPDGRTVTTAGTYISDIVLPSGRDSIITTTLSTIPTSTVTLRAGICEGESYLLPNGTTTTTPGTFSDTLTNSLGCDSIRIAIVTVYPEFSIRKADSIYTGDAYLLPDGNTTSTAGQYIFNLETVSGCDSVITIDLKVLDTTTVTGIRNTISSLPIQFGIQQQQLTISNPTGIPITELNLYNSIGALVLSMQQPSGTIGLPVLPKGIYIIRAITDQNEQHIGKVAIY